MNFLRTDPGGAGAPRGGRGTPGNSTKQLIECEKLENCEKCVNVNEKCTRKAFVSQKSECSSSGHGLQCYKFLRVLMFLNAFYCIIFLVVVECGFKTV